MGRLSTGRFCLHSNGLKIETLLISAMQPMGMTTRAKRPMPEARYEFLELDRCVEQVLELLRTTEELSRYELELVRKAAGQLLLGLQNRESDSDVG